MKQTRLLLQPRPTFSANVAASPRYVSPFHAQALAQVSLPPFPLGVTLSRQVKPTTVLFGGSLPSEFFKRAEIELSTLDLLIIAGTSLQV